MNYLLRLVARSFALLSTIGLLATPAFCQDDTAESSKTKTVSYASQIRPILATSCFGCHQGARTEGKYNMTSFESLLAGGHSGVEAIVPGLSLIHISEPTRLQ